MGPQEYDPWLRVKEAGVPSLREGLSELRAEVVPRNPRSCFSWRERSQRRGERAHRCLVHRRVCGHSRHPSEVAGGNGLPREVLGCPEEQGAYAPGDISLVTLPSETPGRCSLQVICLVSSGSPCPVRPRGIN